MNAADIAVLRQIIREELAAFLVPAVQEPERLDADHMARLILSGRSAEVKQQQRERMRSAA